MSVFYNALTSLEGRYAKALHDTLSSPQDVKSILQEAKNFMLFLKERRDFSITLLTPLVTRTIQMRVLKRVLGALQFSDKFTRFICVVMRHGRLNRLQQIFGILEELYMKENGITPVKVVSAKPLESSELESIELLLVEHFRTPQLSVTINPQLIAGYYIETPEKVFDASFRKQLRLIQLAQHSINES